MRGRQTIGVALLALATGVFTGACGGGGVSADSNALSMSVSGVPPEVPDAGGDVDIELSVNGSADIDLSLESVPSGLTVTLSESTTQGGRVTVHVRAQAGLTPGAYSFVVRATSGEEEFELPISVSIVDIDYNFEVQASETCLTVRGSGSASTQVMAVPVVGPLPAISWSVTGLPSGVSASVVSGVLTVTANGSTVPGSYDASLVGAAQDLQRSTSLLLHVLPASSSSGLTVGTPNVVEVRRGESVAAQVDIERATGITGSVVLATAVLGSVGLTAVLDSNPASQATSGLILSASATAELGQRLVTVTATSGAFSGQSSLLVNVLSDVPQVADVRVQRVEFGQAFLAPDPGLVGDKSALIRAFVVSDQAGTTAPAVRAEGFDGSTSLGTVDLVGPVVLPNGETATSLSQSFTGTLPASWVRAGLEVTVTVDPAGAVTDRDERNDRVRVAPTVSGEATIDLVLVPLIVGGRTPTIPNMTAVADGCTSHWPLSSVQVTTRAAYVVTSVADVQSGGSGWSNVLSELANLRASDGSSAYYYGILDVNYGSGVAGLGYIGAPVSIGWDHSSSVLSTLLHELGHNFGLTHAPCGGPASTDASYPYTGARLGHHGYDRRSHTLVVATSARDIMSYCGPEWISSYNHNKTRSRLENFVVASRVAAAHGASTALLTVEGRLDGAGFDLGELIRSTGVLPASMSDEPTRYWLRLTTASGVVDYAMQLSAIGCGDGVEEHLRVTLPDPGAIARLEVVDASGHAVWSQAVSGISQSVAPDSVEVVEQAGVITLRWDASVWSKATLVHVGAKRTTLGLALTGGVVERSAAGLDRGGVFEVRLVAGLRSAKITVPR